jgi:predicted SAM-dependent methyltransferase
MNKNITLIIPTCGKGNIKECLESINKYTILDNINIIVSANGCSNDYILNNILCYEFVYKVLISERPLGFPGAVNCAIQYMLENNKTEYTLLLNDDVILIDQDINLWINELKKPFENDHLIGITGPHSSFCKYANESNIVFHTVLIKTKLFEEIGLLDESFNLGSGEDTDFCVKAIYKGYKLKNVCNSFDNSDTEHVRGDFPIYHASGKSINTFENRKEVLNKNSEILFNRYNMINKTDKITIIVDDEDNKQYINKTKLENYFSRDVFEKRIQVIFINNSNINYDLNNCHYIGLNKSSNKSERLYNAIKYSVNHLNSDFIYLLKDIYNYKFTELSECMGNENILISCEYIRKLNNYKHEYNLENFDINSDIIIRNNDLIKNIINNNEFKFLNDYDFSVYLTYYVNKNHYMIYSLYGNGDYDKINDVNILNSYGHLCNDNEIDFNINFGSGPCIIYNFVNTDYNLNSSTKYDIDFDVDILNSKVDNGIVDNIILSHVLEHFNKDDGKLCLTNLLNMLKPGGELTMELPDILGLSNRYLDAKTDKEKYEALRTIYGTKQFTHHLYGYDEESLGKLLEEIGYKNIRFESPKFVFHELDWPCLRVLCQK